MPKYSIIVPVYNQLSFTKICVESVLKMSESYDYELIVVTNGCTDGTEDWLLKKREWSEKAKTLVLCSYRKPLGFGGAINVGIRLSQGDYLVLLNNDTQLLSSAWLAMLEEPFSDPKIGITGPILYWSEVTKMNALIFFCTMIKREVVDKIGKLDDVTFPVGAGEDTDFCARAQKAGFELAQVPKTPLKQSPEHMIGGFPIYHIGEGTLQHIPEWNEKGYWEHREALIKKYSVQ